MNMAKEYDIAKTYTLVNTNKSYEALFLYIEKILNKKSKTMKYINDFNTMTLDVLFNSIKLSIYNNISKKELNKIPYKEILFYIKKIGGISYFNKQISSIKESNSLITYFIGNLSKGKYFFNIDGNITINDELIVDSKWLIEFTSFICESLTYNEYLNDNNVFTYKLLEYSNNTNDIKEFMNESIYYEYKINKIDYSKLAYDEIKQFFYELTKINNYNFDELKKINSKISKMNCVLSINKKNIKISKEVRNKIENIFNEHNSITNEIKLIIEKTLNISNRFNKRNLHKLLYSIESIRATSHAYKNNCSINEARKVFDFNKEELYIIDLLSKIYLNYIYEEPLLDSKELLNLSNIKPSIIDYETEKYKRLLNKLSNLNKKFVSKNYELNNSIEQKNEKSIKELTAELNTIIEEIEKNRKILEEEKNNNRKISNINHKKIYYIYNSVLRGQYIFKDEKIILDYYNDKDYHHMFHLEINTK